MELTRVFANWLGAIITTDGTYTATVDSLAEGDTKNPDRVSIVWREEDNRRIADGLREVDLVAEITVPTGTDLVATAVTFQKWLETQVTTANYTALKTAHDTATGDDLQDWFFGDGESDSDRDDYRYLQGWRIWVG